MKTLIRNLVAGPKKKTPYNGSELDLTYITDRIIAMAYPASGFFEKAWRNSIDDVANYLKEYHQGNYLIVNVSSRSYDYSLFDNRVLEYQWPDHQTPPISTLFDIAAKTHQFLKTVQKGVVAVHCNHGKGRTGTAIISILLYLGFCKTTEEALAFYNSRRFSDKNYGVSQLCQIRYLNYVQKLLRMKQIPEQLIAYRLVGATHQGLQEKVFLTIKQVRTDKVLEQRYNFYHNAQVHGSALMGDIFIQIFDEGWSSHKKIALLNFNTFFIDPSSSLDIKSLKKDQIQICFSSKDIKCAKSYNGKSFSIKLNFEYYCLCHIHQDQEIQCGCKQIRQSEEYFWKNMKKRIKEAHSITPEQSRRCLSQSSETDLEVQKQPKIQEQKDVKEIFVLSKNMSNISPACQEVIGIIRQSPECKLQEEELDFLDLKAEDIEGDMLMRERRTQQLCFKNLKDFDNGENQPS